MSITQGNRVSLDLNQLKDKSLKELIEIGRSFKIPSVHLFKEDRLIEKISLAYLTQLREEDNKILARKKLLISTPEDQSTLSGEVLDPNQMSRDEKLEAYTDYHTRLVRVMIYCVNPYKAGLPGELCTVFLPHVGEITRWIPYDEKFCRHGYHVEQCILDTLRDKLFQVIIDEEGTQRGFRTVNHIAKDRPEYTIIEMPDITKEELVKLASHQRQTDRIEG